MNQNSDLGKVGHEKDPQQTPAAPSDWPTFKATNLHHVWAMGGTLAIRCMTCWHGDLLGPDKLPIHRGNQRTIASLKFVCTICGHREFRTEVPPTPEAGAEFFARPVPDLKRKKPPANLIPLRTG